MLVAPSIFTQSSVCASASTVMGFTESVVSEIWKEKFTLSSALLSAAVVAMRTFESAPFEVPASAPATRGSVSKVPSLKVFKFML